MEEKVIKNEIVLFENQNVKLEVNMKDETVWLSQQQMALLFNSSRTNIIEHINNIYSEEELDKVVNVNISNEINIEVKVDKVDNDVDLNKLADTIGEKVKRSIYKDTKGFSNTRLTHR